MIRINPNRTLRREVSSLHHGPLVITIAEEGVYYRPKGRKKSFLLPHGLAYQWAVELRVQRDRAEKKAARKSARKRA